MKSLLSLGEIAGRYDAMICDVWGVVHDGKAPFDTAVAALARFRAERGPVLLLSNAPRPGAEVMAMLDGMKISREAYDAILTSGDATRAAVEARAGEGFYHLGPDRDRPVFDGLPVRETSLEQAKFVLCTGLEDDERETPENYDKLLREAAELALPMLCANPDIVVHRGTKLIWCAGALAAAYEKLGGIVTYFGKPHPPIYDRALDDLEKLAGRAVDPTRIVAVGDGIRTDILGANRAGIDALFISAGIHAERFGEPHAPDHAKLVSELDAEEVFAAATMPRLAWPADDTL